MNRPMIWIFEQWSGWKSLFERRRVLLDAAKTPIEFLEPSGDKEAVTKAFNHLGSMKFTNDEMHHTIGCLSGGQKAKLLLLKMILERCEILILDEPTRNFSP
ncbi:ATP-binding cassette domain-containing protein [Paenibacillus tyrfis]|uniref:ATP-binding cassette domain-containing protein n=1 Tax=Paenibacillus tyrfis TaxID=1501230 RepID=UPI002E1624AC